jgi:hypothetical protein
VRSIFVVQYSASGDYGSIGMRPRLEDHFARHLVWESVRIEVFVGEHKIRSARRQWRQEERARSFDVM